MTWQISLNAAGGLALILLAMLMMTDGLKVFAGGALKHLLGQWTSTPLRGVFAGILVTGVVQSSSAVRVAAIGFVNAGVLTLRQALRVIFGTNVGTTMTGWLVSLAGFGFKIESFALPMLAAGMAIHLLAPGKRPQGLGQALAGFGLFFLGLAILKEAFSSLATSYGSSLPGEGGGWLAYLLAGFIARLRTESMPLDVADDMARALRIARYLNEAARLAPRGRALRSSLGTDTRSPAQTSVNQALADAAACVTLAERGDLLSGGDDERARALDRFQRSHQSAKAASLTAILDGRMSVEASDALLDDLSATRRMIEQLVKADRRLRTPEQAPAIEKEGEVTGSISPTAPAPVPLETKTQTTGEPTHSHEQSN